MGQAAQGWVLEKERKEAGGREHQDAGRGRTGGWEAGVLCLHECEIRGMDRCCKPRAQGNGNSGLYPQGPLPRKESATTSSERNPLTTGTRSDSQRPPLPGSPAPPVGPSPTLPKPSQPSPTAPLQSHPCKADHGSTPSVQTSLLSPGSNLSVCLTANSSLAHSL